jgi:5'(3')-deoxyribonucleotidase
MFFEKNKIPYDDICFTRDKWMIQGDWLIDDNPEFITDERDKSRKIMINMPYNKNCDFSCDRAKDLQEAVDMILEQNSNWDKIDLSSLKLELNDKVSKLYEYNCLEKE